MLKTRLERMESLLQRRAVRRTRSEPAVTWTAARCVEALRVLLGQLAENGCGAGDPFPDLEGEAYLLALWPWFLAHAGAWPLWAQAYARQIAALALGEPGRLVRPNPTVRRRLQTAQDVIDLLEEQADILRATDDAASVATARAAGSLANQARHAIETGQIAAQVEELEAAMERRSHGWR